MENVASEKNLSGIHILLSESCFNLIEPLGALITAAKNAQESVDLFAQSEADSLDAIILELEDKDSLEAIKKIRSLNRADASTIPVIVITDKPREKLPPEIRDEISTGFSTGIGIATGITAVLTKPLEINQLTIILLKYIHQSSKLRIEMLKDTLDCVNKDALTGVNNRMAFEIYEAKITHKIATNKISCFSLIIFDINNLKNTNDLLGHDAGDQLIIDGCKIICNTFKHSPVFRLGGDEFIAFLQGEDYRNRAELLSGFQKKMNKEYFISGAVSIASGISDFIPEKDINVADVFKRADEDMYKTKAKMKKQTISKLKT